jgi:hypothetical protein
MDMDTDMDRDRDKDMDRVTDRFIDRSMYRNTDTNTNKDTDKDSDRARKCLYIGRETDKGIKTDRDSIYIYIMITRHLLNQHQVNFVIDLRNQFHHCVPV